ncbi:uncharacterized protein IWZ02DRAFT_483685 [Phyllosticta citriasiana]|uniref:uncharacterized protein n=1 Tax=Phyllosticta citriasiana TaxID=595635 RepID=UPI0030FD7077
MSDPPPTRPVGAPKVRSPPSSFAFLVSSPDLIQRNLPPNVDNKPLARQRRRRTSPEDQKILETEYQKNSKPDRNERLDIVSRVALGEKEVQVWFQNRRQKDNRRSRPLEPHEIQAHLQSLSRESDVDDAFSSSPVNSSDNKEGTSSQEEVGRKQEEGDASIQHESNAAIPSQPPSQKSEIVTERDVPPHVPRTDDVQPQVATAEPRVNQPPTAAPITEIGSSQPIPSSQESASKSIGYLANRRSQSFAKPYEESSNEKPHVGPVPENQTPARTLRKSSSFVRLSMTEDGKARVVSSEISPSPPRSQPTPTTFEGERGSLRRSYSAVGLQDQLKAAASPTLPWSTSGRSRDSRAWEFWCDSDARNSLTVKANQEGSGSAADAIGLIRSTSKSSLKTNSGKRSAQLISHAPGIGKRQKVDERGTHRPPLSRASSSLGRLQGGKLVNSARSSVQRSQTSRSQMPAEKDGDGFEIPQTESDKENWEPGALGAGQRRSTKPTMEGSGGGAPTLSSSRRRVPLGENTNIITSSGGVGSFETFMDRQKGLKGPSSVSQRRPLGASSARSNVNQRESGITANPEDDDELRAFMGGEASSKTTAAAALGPGSHSHSQRTSVSSGEELGCVQGLLKLSQGNWR